MAELLIIKERIRTFYQKYSRIVIPVFKFLLSLVVFLVINAYLGCDDRLKAPYITMVLSLLCAAAPAIILPLLAALLLILHIKKVSIILAVAMALVFLIMYLAYVRFAPKYSYVIVIMPILYLLKIPFVIPLVLALYSGVTAVIPMVLGVVLYYILNALRQVVLAQTARAAGDSMDVYNQVVSSVVGERYMWYTIILFILVFVIVYFIRKTQMKSASQMAIAIGALVNMIGFLMGEFMFGVQGEIGFMILGTILSAGIASIIQFFRLTLDYTVVENYQFEDDEFYYYVKAVPKLTVTVPKKEVQRIHAQQENNNTANLRDAVQEAYRSSKEYVEAVPEIDEEFDFENDFKVDLEEVDFDSSNDK